MSEFIKIEGLEPDWSKCMPPGADPKTTPPDISKLSWTNVGDLHVRKSEIVAVTEKLGKTVLNFRAGMAWTNTPVKEILEDLQDLI
jgi:hypothetical protein